MLEQIISYSYTLFLATLILWILLEVMQVFRLYYSSSNPNVFAERLIEHFEITITEQKRPKEPRTSKTSYKNCNSSHNSDRGPSCDAPGEA